MLAAFQARDAELIKRVQNQDFKALFSEINQFEEAIAKQALTDSRTKQIFKYHQALSVIRKLNSLSVAGEDNQKIREALHLLKTDRVAEFIVAQTNQSIVLSKKWERFIDAAIHFYIAASKRDRVLEPYLDDFLHDSNQKTAVLVYGGFHQKNLKAIFKKKNLSYQILTPRISSISKVHEDYYKLLMTTGHYSFEVLPNAHVAVSPARVFEVVGAGEFPEYLQSLPVGNWAIDEIDGLKVFHGSAQHANMHSELRTDSEPATPLTPPKSFSSKHFFMTHWFSTLVYGLAGGWIFTQITASLLGVSPAYFLESIKEIVVLQHGSGVYFGPVYWVMIYSFLGFMALVGLGLTKIEQKGKKTRSLKQLLVGHKNAPWYVAGFSDAATNLGADAGTLVDRLVRWVGLQGTGFFMSQPLETLSQVLIFAKFWRKSGEETEVAVTEVRFSGFWGAFLRAYHAFFRGIFSNPLIIASVLIAASLIAETVLGWPMEVTVWVAVAITLAFTLTSGLKTIMFTDIFMWFLGIGMLWKVTTAVLSYRFFDVFGIGGVLGGMFGLRERIIQFNPARIAGSQMPTGESYMHFFGNIDLHKFLTDIFNYNFTSSWVIGVIFLVFVYGFKWLGGANGGGYGTSRDMGAIDEINAMKARAVAGISHTNLKIVPLLIISVASLPLMAKIYNPELAFTVTIMKAMHPGFWPAMMALALFTMTVSPIATQANLGGGIMANDLHKRFLVRWYYKYVLKRDMPRESEDPALAKHLIWAGRFYTALIAVLGALAAFKSRSVLWAVEEFLDIASGVTFITLAKFFTWRISAISEISALTMSLIFTKFLFPMMIKYSAFEATGAQFGIGVGDFDLFAVLGFEPLWPLRIIFNMIVSTMVGILFTYLTKPEPLEKLVVFVDRLGPPKQIKIFGIPILGWDHVSAVVGARNPEYKAMKLGWQFVFNFITGSLGLILIAFGLLSLAFADWKVAFINIPLGLLSFILFLRNQKNWLIEETISDQFIAKHLERNAQGRWITDTDQVRHQMGKRLARRFIFWGPEIKGYPLSDLSSFIWHQLRRAYPYFKQLIYGIGSFLYGISFIRSLGKWFIQVVRFFYKFILKALIVTAWRILTAPSEVLDKIRRFIYGNRGLNVVEQINRFLLSLTGVHQFLLLDRKISLVIAKKVHFPWQVFIAALEKALDATEAVDEVPVPAEEVIKKQSFREKVSVFGRKTINFVREERVKSAETVNVMWQDSAAESGRSELREKTNSQMRDSAALIQPVVLRSNRVASVEQTSNHNNQSLVVMVNFRDFSDAQRDEFFAGAYRNTEHLKLVIYNTDELDERLKPFRSLWKNVRVIEGNADDAYVLAKNLRRSKANSPIFHVVKGEVGKESLLNKEVNSQVTQFRYRGNQTQNGILSTIHDFSVLMNANSASKLRKGFSQFGIEIDNNGFFTVLDSFLNHLDHDFQASYIIKYAA